MHGTSEPNVYLDETHTVDVVLYRGRPMATTNRPLRADAVRNREVLIAAAIDAFREIGPEASLEEIARRAKVGIGTLYRRFPTRAELIEAVHVDQMREVSDLFEDALANAGDDALGALADAMLRTFEIQAADPAFSDVIARIMSGSPLLQHERDRGITAAEKLVELCRKQGSINKSFEAVDLHLGVLAIDGIIRRTKHEAPDAWRRAATGVLNLIAPGRYADAPAPKDWPFFS